jgi:hypothetical protein
MNNGNPNQKVSFDFDGTLSLHEVQVYASSLVDKGYEVWIVTSRYDLDQLDHRWRRKGDDEPWRHQDLFEVAENCGIKKEHIHFTNQEKKARFLEGKGFIFHLDDDDFELIEIMKSNDPKPIHVDHFDWQHNCNEELEKHGEI